MSHLEPMQEVGPFVLSVRLSTTERAQVWLAYRGHDREAVTLKCFGSAEQANEEPGPEVLGDVRHPNLAAVLESGVDDGVHWLAREYVDGTDLYQVFRTVRRKTLDIVRMPPPLACWVFARYAEGIDAAHRHLRVAGGGVHGDLGLEHLLVGVDGALKVINFRGRPLRNPLPQHGVRPSYTSPEEAAGRSTGSRSDVYSLGACLHHLLGGDGHTKRRLEPLPHLDEALQTIVMKALSHTPGERHRWPAQFAADLDGYLASTGQVIGAEQVAEMMQTVFEGRPTA